jgi:hypothetical protein
VPFRNWGPLAGTSKTRMPLSSLNCPATIQTS